MYYTYIETWLLYLMNTSENLYDVIMTSMMTTMNNTCIFINFKKKYTLSDFFFENWICLYNTVFSERSVNNTGLLVVTS